MGKNLKLKKALFSQGALAANSFFGCTDVYVCPICKERFDQSSLESGDLTLEHVPPKAIGGKGIILTCKDCNNAAGSFLDSQISQRDKLDSFINILGKKTKGVAGHATFTLNNTPINVDVHHDGNAISIFFLKDSNDPASITNAKAYLESLTGEGNWKGSEFKLTPKITYHNRLMRVGELRCAFLACTAIFGYSFAFDPILEQVREQICNPHKESLPQWWFTKPAKKLPAPILVSVLDGFVIINHNNLYTLLPWPSRQDDHFWKIAKLFEEKKSIKFSAKPYPWPHFFDALLDLNNR